MTKKLNMKTHGMVYNTNKDELIIMEYGRNIQLMIEKIKKMPDNEERQAYANYIVRLMLQLCGQTKPTQEYKERIWRHLFKIANYDINVTPKDGSVPTPEEAVLKPLRVNYPIKLQEYRHYGANINQLINKAIKTTDEEKRNCYIEVIAVFMKLAYKTWNRDYNVTDELILHDIIKLSGGKLRPSLEFIESLAKLDHRSFRNSTNNATNNHRQNYRDAKSNTHQKSGGYKKSFSNSRNNSTNNENSGYRDNKTGRKLDGNKSHIRNNSSTNTNFNNRNRRNG